MGIFEKFQGLFTSSDLKASLIWVYLRNLMISSDLKACLIWVNLRNVMIIYLI